MSDPMRAMLLQAKTENDALRSYVRECKDEIERLRAIVDRLPVTADGVRVIPEIDWVWNWCALDGGFWQRIQCPRRENWVSKCYSTREAAEAAAREKQ